MINKEKDSKEQQSPESKNKGVVDTAKMDVQCHILIKDKNTNEILVNKRG